MNREQTFVSDALSKMLIKQIMHEQTNANIYGVMSNYFDSIGLELSQMVRTPKEEELGHAQKIIDYCTSAGVDLCFESVKAVDLSDMLDPVKLMKHYLDLEIETTESIRLLCKQSLVDSDFISFNFLNDFIKIIKRGKRSSDKASDPFIIQKIGSRLIVLWGIYKNIKKWQRNILQHLILKQQVKMLKR